MSDKLQILADYTWMGWSSIPSLDVKHRSLGVTLTDERLGGFKDSSPAAACSTQYTDALRLRAGMAYDESP